MDATTIGLDIAKSVFHVHVADHTGRAILSRKLRRAQLEPFFAKHPKSVVGMERAARRITGAASLPG